MVAAAFGPGAALSLPSAAAACVAWRSGGQLQISVIAKATFAFEPDADMTRADPQPIVSAEVHHANNPGRSVRFTSDLVPHLGRADVLFTGHAYAPASPSGRPPSVPARLAIFRGDAAVLDKTILVRTGAEPVRVPVVYEETFGGLGSIENLFGRGAAPNDPPPRIFHPSDPQRPACFAPIARTWPARKRLLGATPRHVLEGPIAEIPSPFDWSYFQAAPADQRTDFLHGDEWIVLEALHPTMPRLRTRLPDVRGLARIHGLSAFGVAEGALLDLHLDTLRVDGDEQRCTVVFRRSFPVASEGALREIRAVAGVRMRGEALTWFDPPPRGEPAIAPFDASAAAPALSDATMALPADASGGPALPFAADLAPSLAPSAAAPAARADLGSVGSPATIAISNEDEPGSRAITLPFVRGSSVDPVPASIPRPAKEMPVPVDTGTVAFVDDVPAAMVSSALPFGGQDGAPTTPAPVVPPNTAPPQMEFVPPPESAQRWVGVAEPPRIGPLATATPAPAAPPERAVDPSVVPYFDPPAATPAAAAAAREAARPAIDPVAFTVERYAAVLAELAEGRAMRGDVLAVQDLDEAGWALIDRHWAEAIKRDGKQGSGKLMRAYDAAYVARVEGFRGPITAVEYARLGLAGERGQSDDVLDELGIQRAARMSVIRVWAKRLAGDARLRGEVAVARARLMEE